MGNYASNESPPVYGDSELFNDSDTENKQGIFWSNSDSSFTFPNHENEINPSTYDDSSISNNGTRDEKTNKKRGRKKKQKLAISY